MPGTDRLRRRFCLRAVWLLAFAILIWRAVGTPSKAPQRSALATLVHRESAENVPVSEMRKTMGGQPAALRRLLDDDSAIEDAAAKLRGRRTFLVGTGTSWHAANQGTFLLRLAGVAACAVQAADAAVDGPRPGSEDGLILLSHTGANRFTNDVLDRARGDGAVCVVISGDGVAGADIETVPQETSSAYTASHLGALMRLAQLAVALGADLGDLAAVPDAVEAALDSDSP